MSLAWTNYARFYVSRTMIRGVLARRDWSHQWHRQSEGFNDDTFAKSIARMRAAGNLRRNMDVDLVLGTDLLNVFRMRMPNAVLRKQELELLVRAYAARDLDIDLSDAVVRLDRAPGLQPDSMEGVLCCGLQHSTWRKITSLIKDEGMRLRSAQPLISFAQSLAEQALVGESLLADGKMGLLLVEPECITTLVWSGNGTEHARTKQGSDSRASASEALVRMCGQTGLTPDETVVGLGTCFWREGPLDTIVLPEDLLSQQPITGLLTSLSGAAR